MKFSGEFDSISGNANAPSTVPWSHFEWLAKTAVSSTVGSYIVVVVSKGGIYNLDNARKDGQGNDNGQS